MAKKKLNRKRLNAQIPVFTGIQHTDKIATQLFKYNKDNYVEDLNFSENKFNGFEVNDNQNWLNTHGIHDVEQILTICNKIGIHYLTIQDILDVNQRPKFQDFQDYWFFSIKSLFRLQIKTLTPC